MPRYTCEFRCETASIANVLAKIREHGVAVRPRVFTPEQCALANEQADAMVAYYSPGFDRSDPSTYAQARRDTDAIHRMLMQHHGIGHWEHAWNARQEEEAAKVHAAFHECEPRDMLSSVDGISVSLGSNRLDDNSKHWFHRDQSLLRNGEECLQSFVTFNNVGENAATLRVLVGSHLLGDDFSLYKQQQLRDECDQLPQGTMSDDEFAQFKADQAKEMWKKMGKGDWYKLTEDDVKWFVDRGCEDVCICAEPGDQVFWESRLIHCGQEAHKDYDGPFRNVVYLCFRPRTHFPRLAQVLETRRAMLNPLHADPAHPLYGKYLRTTNHWGTVLFSRLRFRGTRKEILLPPHPVLTEYGEIIAGLK